MIRDVEQHKARRKVLGVTIGKSGTIATMLYWKPPGTDSTNSGPTLTTSMPARFSCASLVMRAAASLMVGSMSSVGVLVADM
jgi:hypothetical protein